MGWEAVTMEDCASNYGVFEVEGSKGRKYTVTLDGSEGQAYCTCKAFEFSKRKTCKHIDLVHKEACLYNPQWHDAKKSPKIRPTSYTYDKFTKGLCDCGGPLVAVKRAV